jgi:hypothetical protein
MFSPNRLIGPLASIAQWLAAPRVLEGAVNVAFVRCSFHCGSLELVTVAVGQFDEAWFAV